MIDQYITIENLKKLEDSSYVYFNTNTLYYLLSEYNREKGRNPKDEYFNQCLDLILNCLDEIKRNEYYGYEGSNSSYHCLKVLDAKMLLHFYEDKKDEYELPPTTLKYCRKVPFYVLNKEKLKEDYQELMDTKTVEEQKRSELKRRKEQGYIL